MNKNESRHVMEQCGKKVEAARLKEIQTMVTELMKSKRAQAERLKS